MASEAPSKDFVLRHAKQLKHLNIPSPLFDHLESQLHRTFATHDGDPGRVLCASRHNFAALCEQQDQCGSLVVIPHLCSWDMLEEASQGMWRSLEVLPVSVLKSVLQGFEDLFGVSLHLHVDPDDKKTLLNKLCVSRTWSRVILYRQEETDRVRAALPVPPYLPHVQLDNEADQSEAELTGPFPFRYHLADDQIVECSLGYLSPSLNLRKNQLPTLDVSPSYSVKSALTRSVRYAALLGDRAPEYSLQQVKKVYADFVHRMHLIRQKNMEQVKSKVAGDENPDRNVAMDTNSSSKVWKVYTDADDPMQLSHPEAGLASPNFSVTSSVEEADIVYSYRSLFAPGDLRKILDEQPHILINQFPYEGAFVQKDHLGREILRQHGLPRPNWALETYDLDVQLAEFVGAAMLESERKDEENPLWIVKPARGTQSKGHLVTRSLAHILRLIDCGGESRVAQRYIENPVCYDGRKVDCRCVVMMTSAACQGRPTLFMHNRVYFRIAGDKHSVSQPSDLMDKSKVLTAMHLVNGPTPKESDVAYATGKLPVDYKTIAHLEEQYSGFNWKFEVLPKIHTMIRELFNGMTDAYRDMAKASNSRALYGVDVMFDIGEDEVIEPKLTEVTFCPSNNAICKAYEHDDLLYKNYNNDIFSCLFLGKVNGSITRLQ